MNKNTSDNSRWSQDLQTLYPIMRSITGAGVRDTLDHLATIVPLERHSIASGTRVLDWEIPREWCFRSASIEDSNGHRLIDAAESSLHVVNYSVPVDALMTREELEPHLHTLPEQPDAIPYRTSYYNDSWGFCLTQHQYANLGDGPFQVRIDTELFDGHLDYAEVFIEGKSEHEILVSTHICHPSLANDNLSGMLVAAQLAASLQAKKQAVSWRFLFIPGTIGAIAWLDRQLKSPRPIIGGLVLTGLGDASNFTWKQSCQENAWIDRVVQQALQTRHGEKYSLLPFGPYGYDERQFGSPGFRLPTGRLTRAVHGTFPEYHTSDDNLDFISDAQLDDALALLEQIAETINADKRYTNLQPYAEPQLGRRGLYNALGAQRHPGDLQMAMLWVLNQSDGHTSLLEIAEKSGIAMAELMIAADMLESHKLLRCEGHACDDQPV